MAPELTEALCRLCSSGETFEAALRTFERYPKAARRHLLRLLRHEDPAWRRGAATAMGRLRDVPAAALPDLVKLLRSTDASNKFAAISAIDHLPAGARARAVRPMVGLLLSSPDDQPRYTRLRAHLPRGAAAYFLAVFGGRTGLAALKKAARRRKDPVRHHVKAALQQALQGRRARVTP